MEVLQYATLPMSGFQRLPARSNKLQQRKSLSKAGLSTEGLGGIGFYGGSSGGGGGGGAGGAGGGGDGAGGAGGGGGGACRAGGNLMLMHLLTYLPTKANAMLRHADHTLNRTLANMLELRVPAGYEPYYGIQSWDVTISKQTGVWARVYSSPQNGDEGLPVVVHYHGGGFAFLSASNILYDMFCRRLASRTPCIVVSINYRKAPEHKYPTAHEDAYRGLEWVVGSEEAKRQLPANMDLDRIFLCGDSAGGNLVHHVGCKAAKEEITIRGHILIQPLLGGKKRTESEIKLKNVPIISSEAAEWCWSAYLPKGEDRDHRVSNIFGPNAESLEDVSLPPSLLVVGGYDVLKDRQLGFAQGLQRAHKQCKVLLYDEGVHCFHLFYLVNSLSNELLDEIANFVNTQ